MANTIINNIIHRYKLIIKYYIYRWFWPAFLTSMSHSMSNCLESYTSVDDDPQYMYHK